MVFETSLGLSDTDWIAFTAIFTALLWAVAVVAALYTFQQVKIARAQAEEARTAEIEANRPYVIVMVEPSAAVGLPFFDLVVKNIGRRPALNVSIKLDPPPVRAREAEGAELAKTKMFNRPVAMIAPGQEMRTFYDSAIDRNGRDDLPTSHTVHLAYEDSSGRPYPEESVLDVNALEGIVYTSVKTVHDIGKALIEIQKTLKGASILGRRGAVEVDASVEPRSEKEERQAQE